MNCWLVPSATVGLAGFTAIETNAGARMVRVTEFVTKPDVPVIVVEPCVNEVTNPWLPGLLLMVATELEEELHATEAVMFCVLPSVNVPVAVNCC